MPEPAALGPRRLWRAVIRPLVTDGSGDILCDTADATVAEGLLATTDAVVHTVRRGVALDELSQIYGGRLVLHADAATAWTAAPGYRLAVFDIDRARGAHMAALDALVAGDVAAPPALIQGLAGRGVSDPALADFSARGWLVIELPGFDQIRLVVPGGRGALDTDTIDKILEHLRSGPAMRNEATEAAAARIEELTGRMRELELQAADAAAAQELAERRREASEDIVAALRRFNDAAQIDLARAQRESQDLRALLHSTQSDAAAARARSASLFRTHHAVREDLVRLQASQSWRIGHWLSRIGRVLTFRKPGRTNAVSKAIERIDATMLPGDDHR